MRQPLVSILIPTHNRIDLFKVAFQSAINQTYKNIEIVISDDSDNDETYQYMHSYISDSRIKYKWNKGFTAKQNWHWVLANSRGDYFNYLLDDDVFAPDKIEKMVAIYEQYPDVSLVTSHRQLIDINGNHLDDIRHTAPIVNTSSILSGDSIYYEILRTNTNFIGELTTVLIRGIYKELLFDIMDLDSVLPDVIMWLALCEQGDVAYLTDTLSYFRLHGGNDQFNPMVQLRCYNEWSKIYYVAYTKTDIEERKKLYLNLHVVGVKTTIDFWLELLNDERNDKEIVKKHKNVVDEVVDIYMNFAKCIEGWPLDPQILNYIREYRQGENLL